MTDRNYIMEILNASRKADVQTLTRIASELATSLLGAEATIRELRSKDESRREGQRRRTRDWRSSDAGNVTPVTGDESSPFSPTPPFSPPTSSTSSSARVPVWRPAEEAALAGRLPSDRGKVALAAVLARCGDKRSVAAEIAMILDGGRPNVSHRPEHMELALSDYAANGLSDGRFNAAHFRRHVQRAAKPEAQNGVREGVGKRTFDNGMRALGND